VLSILRRHILLLVSLVLVTIIGFAQDSKQASHTITIGTPAVALLDLEGPSEVNMAPASPSEAGHSLNFENATNSAMWINVSSIVGETTQTSRNITVQLTTGVVPSGLILKVRTANSVGDGQGNFGTVLPEIILSEYSKNIISGVGSCYTGNGVSSGYNITYTLEKSNPYGNIKFDEPSQIVVAYTLSD